MLTNSEKNCYRCNGLHNPDSYYAKTWSCHKCSKIEHIAKACKSSRYQRYNSSTHQVGDSVNTVQGLSYESTGHDTVPLFTVYSTEAKGKSDKITVPVKVEGTKITFIVDTGAARSIVSESLYHNHLSHLSKSSPSVREPVIQVAFIDCQR